MKEKQIQIYITLGQICKLECSLGIDVELPLSVQNLTDEEKIVDLLMSLCCAFEYFPRGQKQTHMELIMKEQSNTSKPKLKCQCGQSDCGTFICANCKRSTPYCFGKESTTFTRDTDRRTTYEG